MREELERPYGYFGRWQDVCTDVEILAVESSVPQAPGALAEAGALLLSAKEAAAHLGIGHSAMYELINKGDIEHVRVGNRIYVSRTAMQQFIEANSHRGYWRP